MNRNVYLLKPETKEYNDYIVYTLHNFKYGVLIDVRIKFLFYGDEILFYGDDKKGCTHDHKIEAEEIEVKYNGYTLSKNAYIDDKSGSYILNCSDNLNNLKNQIMELYLTKNKDCDYSKLYLIVEYFYKKEEDAQCGTGYCFCNNYICGYLTESD